MDMSIAVETALTEQERTTLLVYATARWPRIRGARVSDVIDIVDEENGLLDALEPFLAEHGAGLCAAVCESALVDEGEAMLAVRAAATASALIRTGGAPSSGDVAYLATCAARLYLDAPTDRPPSSRRFEAETEPVGAPRALGEIIRLSRASAIAEDAAISAVIALPEDADAQTRKQVEVDAAHARGAAEAFADAYRVIYMAVFAKPAPLQARSWKRSADAHAPGGPAEAEPLLETRTSAEVIEEIICPWCRKKIPAHDAYQAIVSATPTDVMCPECRQRITVTSSHFTTVTAKPVGDGHVHA